mgnify:CR=1 FL=1
MKVPFNYLPYEFKNNSKIFKDWRKLIKSTDFTLGKYVDDFEKKFSKYIGSKNCISVNNGTDALILCLKAIGVKTGDEVITVCNTFYATVGAIVAAGAKPVFVDCDSRFQIDESKIEKAITKKTKAIIPVHWGGASPNMKKIVKIAKNYKIEIVEDACMGIGAKLDGKSPGTFGRLGAYSMHPLKSLNVMGDGGMLVSNDKDLISWLRKYRNHGMVNRDEIEFWGLNKRLQPLQAIVASHGLDKIKNVINIRNKNAKKLDKGLSNLFPHVKVPKRLKTHIETFALYMITCERRDELVAYLNAKNIEVKIHYPIPLHLQKAASKLGYKKGDFNVAEDQANKLVTLPVHQFLNNNQINYIIKSIYDFYG